MKEALVAIVVPAVLVLAAVSAHAFLPSALVAVYPEGSERTQKSHTLAISLVKAHDQNATRFRLEHAGDRVRANGRVQRVHQDGLVELKGRWGHKLYCHFQDPADAVRLSPGDRLTLSGTVRDARRTDHPSPGRPTGEARLDGCRAEG